MKDTAVEVIMVVIVENVAITNKVLSGSITI